MNISGAMASLVLGAIRFYQAALRPLMPWGCKFYPSCSHYALKAIEANGLSRGLALTARRLLRCRPGTFGGYDPVPDEPQPPRSGGYTSHDSRFAVPETPCRS